MYYSERLIEKKIRQTILVTLLLTCGADDCSKNGELKN
jgi:hypothetical protein